MKPLPRSSHISIILSRFRHHHDLYLGSIVEIHILNPLSFAGFEWAAAPYETIPLEETGLLHSLRLKMVGILSKLRRNSLFRFILFFFSLGWKGGVLSSLQNKPTDIEHKRRGLLLSFFIHLFKYLFLSLWIFFPHKLLRVSVILFFPSSSSFLMKMFS